MGQVVVVGSINMDVVAQTERLPRPGETLVGHALNTIPGGKGANQAVAARRLGSDVRMIGALGSDQFASALRAFLSSETVDIEGVETVAGSSGTALIIVERSGENSIVIVPGANDHLAPNVIGQVSLAHGDVVLLQNEVPERANQEAIRKATEVRATRILNLAPYRQTDIEMLNALDYLVVNETEFALLLDEQGINVTASSMSPARVAGLLAEAAGPDVDIVVTLGADGLQARLSGSVITVPGLPVQVVDTTGAGDCFCGAFGAALASGSDPEKALRLANAAAALSVTTLGAGPSMPTRDAVDAMLDPS